MATAMSMAIKLRNILFILICYFSAKIVFYYELQVLLPYIMDNEPKIILFMRNYISTDSRPYQKVERKCDRSLYK